MRDSITFLLGDTPRTLRGFDPAMTVLRYLREVERRCGTKEGCAEGDCGACTVVLGKPDGDGMAYQPVNACILFLHALDGRQLLTVEDLHVRGAPLHPVQQAMVDHHGSQCGFCTPGFVMSLFALAHDAPDRADIGAALAGNLCRCTGYRPIVAAAGAVRAEPVIDGFAVGAAETARTLTALRNPSPLALDVAGTRLYVPTNADDLVELLAAHPEATILAGGTDIGLWVTKGHRRLPVVISLEAVEGLEAIELRDGCIEVGARVTHEALLPVLAGPYPAFAAMLRRFGSRQVRTRGTLCGNVANGSPIGDAAPALIALGAEVRLRGSGGVRTMPVEDYFVGYRQTALALGEFVERVCVPLPRPGESFHMWKVSKRFEQDISAVCGAFRLTLDGERIVDARIGFGGVAAIPFRARATEAALIGAAWNEATLVRARAALAGELRPISDMRASAEYRRAVACNLLTKLHAESWSPGSTPALAEMAA